MTYGHNMPPPPPSFEPGGSSWQHSDPRASCPLISGDSYDEHIFDETAYDGFGSQAMFQTPPPHATQDTQTATQETQPDQDEHVYGRGHRPRRGPAIRLSPSGPRPRKL